MAVEMGSFSPVIPGRLYDARAAAGVTRAALGKSGNIDQSMRSVIDHVRQGHVPTGKSVEVQAFGDAWRQMFSEEIPADLRGAVSSKGDPYQGYAREILECTLVLAMLEKAQGAQGVMAMPDGDFNLCRQELHAAAGTLFSQPARHSSVFGVSFSAKHQQPDMNGVRDRLEKALERCEGHTLVAAHHELVGKAVATALVERYIADNPNHRLDDEALLQIAFRGKGSEPAVSALGNLMPAGHERLNLENLKLVNRQLFTHVDLVKARAPKAPANDDKPGNNRVPTPWETPLGGPAGVTPWNNNQVYVNGDSGSAHATGGSDSAALAQAHETIKHMADLLAEQAREAMAMNRDLLASHLKLAEVLVGGRNLGNSPVVQRVDGGNTAGMRDMADAEQGMTQQRLEDGWGHPGNSLRHVDPDSGVSVSSREGSLSEHSANVDLGGDSVAGDPSSRVGAVSREASNVDEQTFQDLRRVDDLLRVDGWKIPRAQLKAAPPDGEPQPNADVPPPGSSAGPSPGSSRSSILSEQVTDQDDSASRSAQVHDQGGPRQVRFDVPGSNAHAEDFATQIQNQRGRLKQTDLRAMPWAADFDRDETRRHAAGPVALPAVPAPAREKTPRLPVTIQSRPLSLSYPVTPLKVTEALIDLGGQILPRRDGGGPPSEDYLALNALKVELQEGKYEAVLSPEAQATFARLLDQQPGFKLRYEQLGKYLHGTTLSWDGKQLKVGYLKQANDTLLDDQQRPLPYAETTSTTARPSWARTQR